MSKYNVGNLVAECLEYNGVDTVFGIISVHNIPIMDGISLRTNMRMVMTRGETGAAHMADGFGRASDKLGVVISSTGPGASNAVPGLVEARFAGTPMLHITGQTATANVDRGQGTVHDVPDQLGMLRSVSKAAYRVRSAQETLGVLKQAILEARTSPSGPVSIEIPIDIQRAEVRRPHHPEEFKAHSPNICAPKHSDIARLAELVSYAEKPMLWVGAGARNAGDPITALLEMGFGMVTSWAGRGVVSDDHPMNLGALNGVGSPAVQTLYEEVDLMLVVGSRLRGHETMDMKSPMPANLIQIDVDPQADGRTYPNRFFVCGDSTQVLTELIEELRGRLNVDPDYPERVRQTKREAVAMFKKTLGPYSSFPEQLRAVMPRDAIWARDITLSNSTWGHRIFPLHSQRDNIYPIGAGIGQGLQLGIGAAFGANGRKVVLLTGDGGFFFNMTELWTAVQERADIVMIVMNDNGYGVIKHMQDAMCEGRRNFGDLLGPDLLKLAELAGIPAWRVSKSDQFGATVAQALKIKGPSLVEVDMNAIGEFPPYFPYSEMIAKAQQARVTE